MVTPQTTGDPSRDTSPGTSTPRRKEKKKVGFHHGDPNRPTSIVVDDGTSQHELMSLEPETSPDAVPENLTSPRPSPPELAGPSQVGEQPITPTGAPDATELRRALTKILSTQDENARGRQGRVEKSPPTASPGPSDLPNFRSPQKPMRPVLRRDTSYDVYEERVKADIAEMNTGEREQRSGRAARERAHNLAVRVENYASPYASQRPSLDSEDDLEMGSRAARGTVVDMGDKGASRNTKDEGQKKSRPRRNSHLRPEVLMPAENLVRAHTQRFHHGHERKSSAESHPDGYFHFKPASGAPSGAVTPEPVQAYAHDYVPKPTRYHGGILGSLLKLYNESTGSGNNSRGSTPAQTPQHSPPSSAAPSTPGSPRPSRPSSGIWSGLHGGGSPGNGSGDLRAHHKNLSSSSLGLGELIKSTSTLMAPGSSTSGIGVAERIRQTGPNMKRRSGIFGGTDSPKTTKPKKSKQAKTEEKLRITKHIARILSRHQYLIKLCRALMMYGAPTHRLEEYMTMSARILEIEGQFLYLPGCMIISFDDSATHTTEVKIVRQKHGINLGKLREAHIIYKEVVHDLISVDEATARLDEILKRDLQFGTWVRVLVYGLASAAVAPFAFGGRFIDLPIAFILGCLLGWMQLVLAPSNYLYANVFEISAAIVTSFLARMFGSLRGGSLFCFSALAQSSIALILPGYMVLCSALELQSHNVVAGSVRMVYAMIYTLFLGYGMTIGTAIYGIIDRAGATSQTQCRDSLDRSWHPLFVLLFTIFLCIINQAKWKQMPVMVTISILGYLANSYSATVFTGGQISNMLGALAVGILANLYSRLGRHVHNRWLDFLDWWDVKVRPRFGPASRRRNGVAYTAGVDTADDTDEPKDNQNHSNNNNSSNNNNNNNNNSDNSDNSNRNNGADAGTQPEAPPKRQRTVGYGLAAAAMLPAIFVQVPGGLAAGGSLLAGLSTANQITRSNSTITTFINGTLVNITSSPSSTDAAAESLGIGSGLNTTAFTVLFNVIQVAIGITVGLFLSTLIVYPFGKRRSGLLSL